MSQPPAVPGPEDVDALAAALRADSADLEVYARVLTESLADALPPGMVVVDRDQSMRDRLAGRPGVVRMLRIELGDTTLQLVRGTAGTPVARAARTVRGVTISSREVTVTEWTTLLAEQLAASARESAAARAALARLLGSS